MDKEEEDMEEDKNDMIGRNDEQRDDHARRNRYRLLGDTHEETVD